MKVPAVRSVLAKFDELQNRLGPISWNILYANLMGFTLLLDPWDIIYSDVLKKNTRKMPNEKANCIEVAEKWNQSRFSHG